MVRQVRVKTRRTVLPRNTSPKGTGKKSKRQAMFRNHDTKDAPEKILEKTQQRKRETHRL